MKKMSIFLILIVAAILAGFVWLTKDTFATEKTLPVFRMSGKAADYGELLLVRRVSANGNILLKRLREKAIYQYDIDRKVASEVSEDVWNNASEKISVCAGEFDDDRIEQGKYTIYGNYLLAFNVSPGKTKTAFLSAYGPRIKDISLMPFMGGGYTIYGTRYLEIKKVSEAYTNIGKPFRVRRMLSPQLCWTEDENSVVIFDDWNFEFSVADFNPQPAQAAGNTTKQTASKPDLSRLTGVARDYGVDEDGDGLFEKIAIEIETETSLPAEYTIFVDLEANTGRHFAERARVELKGGVETTKLLFDTKPFFDEKIDGVFKISFVDLDYKDDPMLERREDFGQTREYKLSEFQRPNIIFTGENVVAPIDKNRDGKYEGLQIEVGVDVLDANDYEFQGALYDEFSTVTSEGVVEFFHGKTNLKKGKGTITFFFSGEKIIKHGKSGKFRLRNVVVHKTGQSAPYVENLLETPAFDVNQFGVKN